MTFQEAIGHCFSNYAKFTGRASLYEFWYWMIFTMLGTSAGFIMDEILFPEYTVNTIYPLMLTFVAITILPGLAVGVRRLHDTGRNGLWILLLPTLIGYAVLIFWWLKPGDTQENSYGSPPALPGETF